MKLITKILPLTATVAVATIPVVATSCSQVWTDSLGKQYEPTYKRLDAQELSKSEAEVLFFDKYLADKNCLNQDFYWGTSMYAREMLPVDIGAEVRVALSHLYGYNLYKDSEGAYRMSYSFRTQFETKTKSEIGSKSSYCINTYDIYWEIADVEVQPIYWYKGYGEQHYSENFYIWTICPKKFDFRQGKWYDELAGSEKIVFNFKTVSKGYSETGAQNFIRETNESAIIDEQHKYVPQLSEIYSGAMMLESYYLSACSPRLYSNDDYYMTEVTEAELEAGVQIPLVIGTQTRQNYEDNTITFSNGHQTIVQSDSSYEVQDITGTSTTISSETAINPAIKITKKSGTGSLKSGDKIFVTINADCPAKGTYQAWQEPIYWTFIIK